MTLPVLIFEVAETRLAIAAADVREVLPAPPVTVVPGAPAAIAGATAIRGEIVPVVDLGRLLGRAPRLVRPGDLLIAIEVSATGGTRSFSEGRGQRVGQKLSIVAARSADERAALALSVDVLVGLSEYEPASAPLLHGLAASLSTRSMQAPDGALLPLLEGERLLEHFFALLEGPHDATQDGAVPRGAA